MISVLRTVILPKGKSRFAHWFISLVIDVNFLFILMSVMFCKSIVKSTPKTVNDLGFHSNFKCGRKTVLGGSSQPNQTTLVLSKFIERPEYFAYSKIVFMQYSNDLGPIYEERCIIRKLINLYFFLEYFKTFYVIILANHMCQDLTAYQKYIWGYRVSLFAPPLDRKPKCWVTVYNNS